jgi:hypothetical protein
MWQPVLVLLLLASVGLPEHMIRACSIGYGPVICDNCEPGYHGASDGAEAGTCNQCTNQTTCPASTRFVDLRISCGHGTIQAPPDNVFTSDCVCKRPSFLLSFLFTAD